MLEESILIINEKCIHFKEQHFVLLCFYNNFKFFSKQRWACSLSLTLSLHEDLRRQDFSRSIC